MTEEEQTTESEPKEDFWGVNNEQLGDETEGDDVQSTVSDD